jgi:hypothetical protein
MQIQFFSFFQDWGTSVGSDFVVLGPVNPLRHAFKVSRTTRKSLFIMAETCAGFVLRKERDRDRERLRGGQVKILLLHHQFLDFGVRS